ncbi:ParA family protein [Chlamydiifrater volucris]|uniref:ParA family protein n=1 Tax=Chlamydiifrater volucris TaxID=2681470 RepID=UPI001BD0CC34|nr:ParA family protein [Chlamydiifrater volucris]
MKVITFCSFKGGTGKTTLSMNVACYFSERKNKKVLLVDMDPQANLTTYVGVGSADSLGSFNLLMNRSRTVNFVRRTKIKNLDIIPSCVDSEFFRGELADGDSFLSGNLKTALKDNLDYDVCIIDTPPSLGFIVRESFSATDDLVICLSPEPFSVIGLHKIKEFLTSFSNLKVLGAAISFWDSRNSTNRLYLKNIESVFPFEVPCYFIRRDVSFSRSVLKESPVFFSYPNSRASVDVINFSEEIFKSAFSKSLKSIG